ncbi:MAG: low molecular weight phosphotyrosine protein phosphatase [Myxococcales bacterium]|nr:low molecular weight phosphotyrosine protein phosphatase [Myxococcales bacterium]
MSSSIGVCFVCLGNICRSPTAEGVMLHLVHEVGLAERIRVDSSGTGAYHVGERADRRSREEASRRGVNLESVARQFAARDFDRFDYLVAMDRDNFRDMLRLCPSPAHRDKLSLLRSFEPGATPGAQLDVPDPYYGGDDGFARVYDIVLAGCRGLLEHIRRQHGL